MARKLVCSQCNQYIKQESLKFKEFWESVYGKSKSEYVCDSCGKDIKLGDGCYAGVLLISKEDENYNYQKPEIWLHEYIRIIK